MPEIPLRFRKHNDQNWLLLSNTLPGTLDVELHQWPVCGTSEEPQQLPVVSHALDLINMLNGSMEHPYQAVALTSNVMQIYYVH